MTSATGPTLARSLAASNLNNNVSIATKGARELISAVENKSSGRIRFIGMWHTHPRALPSKSPTGKQAMHDLGTNTSHPLHRALLVIAGSEQENWDSWLESSGIPVIYTRFALFSRQDSSDR